MNSRIGGRTASQIPGLDLAEQNSWQNYLTATLRLYGVESATDQRSPVANGGSENAASLGC